MFATLQKVGRSLMLPIAVLPAAGLLLRLGLLLIEWIPGHAYQPGDVVFQDKVVYECVQAHEATPESRPSATAAEWKAIETTPARIAFGKTIADAGDIIFANLPLLFAIGVAVGGGEYHLAMIATAVTLAVLIVLNPVERWIDKVTPKSKEAEARDPIDDG